MGWAGNISRWLSTTTCATSTTCARCVASAHGAARRRDRRRSSAAPSESPSPVRASWTNAGSVAESKAIDRAVARPVPLRSGRGRRVSRTPSAPSEGRGAGPRAQGSSVRGGENLGFDGSSCGRGSGGARPHALEPRYDALKYGAPPVTSARPGATPIRVWRSRIAARASTRIRAASLRPVHAWSHGPKPGRRSGLGLAIAQAYARAHGGDIVYGRDDPHGARFEVVIPLNESGQTRHRRPPASPTHRG